MKVSGAALVVALGATAVHATTVFDFSTLPQGVEENVVTSGGSKATISGGNGTYFVEPNGGVFVTLSPDVMEHPITPTDFYIAIVFNNDFTMVSIPFAVNSTAVSLSLTAFFDSGQTAGTASADGVVPGGGTFAEGVITFSGSPFKDVFLGFSTGGTEAVLGNFTGDAAAPEPGTFLMLGVGLAALRVAKWRFSWL
jgi:hypothetical protein